MKYLDLTGLEIFWGKIKTLVTNALVGYAKTSDIPADYTVISLSADSGTLTTAQLTKLKANPHKTVLKRSGYCYFVEDLSSSTMYKYSRNIYHSDNKIYKQVIAITTSSGAYSKSELDYTYVHPATHPASMITGLATVATSGSYTDLSNKPSIPSIEGLASEFYVNEKVAGVVNSAPETLDTLKELSKALGDDPNFATTVANKIGNLQTAVDGKAALSHGNHVPATEAANNAKFLRNDNTWQTVTPANIGAAAASHGTHVTYATATPSANGNAKVGTSAKVAREDHVHPLQTTVSGNAGTASKLATARTIALNGDVTGSVSFNGSADVTITATVADDSHNHIIANVDGLQSALNARLEKTTYEKSAELACGSNGKVCLGKFGAYDTNITIELNSTTHTTYHATIVIHSQNVVANGTGGTVGCYVYGDADNHITPLISVFRPYGSASRQIEVYANLEGWSKNLVHVQGVALSDGGMTDVLTSVTEIPTAIAGKTKVTPVNALTTNFASKNTATPSANGLMSLTDKAKLDGLPTFSFDPETGTLTITSS